MNIALSHVSLAARFRELAGSVRERLASREAALRTAISLRRYGKMSDAELALRGLDRETLNAVVKARHRR